jgi:hypothetical protein
MQHRHVGICIVLRSPDVVVLTARKGKNRRRFFVKLYYVNVEKHPGRRHCARFDRKANLNSSVARLSTVLVEYRMLAFDRTA